MHRIAQRASPLLRDDARRRGLASFAELYRQSVSNAEVRPGDPLVGHVVGRRSGRSRTSASRFFVVDFGLKNEAPFASREIPGASTVGARVALPLVAVEDDFDEPSLDHARRSALPAAQAERLSLLTDMESTRAQVVHGRFAGVKRGGASAKALGVDAFVPRHHVVALSRPLLGSFAPFYVLSAVSPSTSSRDSVEVAPVLSSYGAYLFALANLVGSDAAWRTSGGGSVRERIGYLRLLTRIIVAKNAAVRRIMPHHDRSGGSHGRGVYNHRNPRQGRRQHTRRPGGASTHVATRPGMWLDDIREGHATGDKEKVELRPRRNPPKRSHHSSTD